MSSDENKAAAADKPTEDDGAKKPVTDTDDDEDRVRKKFKTVASITSHQIICSILQILQINLFNIVLDLHIIPVVIMVCNLQFNASL